MTIKSSRFTVLFLFALALMMMAVEVRGDYAASLPSAGCPTGYTRINNACYQLVNTLFNWTQANDSCYLEYGITYNDTLSGFAGTVTHLAAFESLAEIMSAYIWLQAEQNFLPFYIDGVIYNATTDLVISWSDQPYTSWGFLYELITGQPYLNLILNSSAQYEIDDSEGRYYYGYMCEANVPCKITENRCMNNASCFVNGGRVLCICPPGYEGTLCENVVDMCLSVPCLHGGTCTNRIDGYNCTCTKYYNGTNCSVPTRNPAEGQRSAVLAVNVTLLCLLLGVLMAMDVPWSRMREALCPTDTTSEFARRQLEEEEREQEEREREEAEEAEGVEIVEEMGPDGKPIKKKKKSNKKNKKRKYKNISEQDLIHVFKQTLTQTKTL